MADPETRALELDRHRRETHVRPVRAPAAGEHVIDHRRADEQRQEFVQDQPVVVPEHETLRLREDLLWIHQAERLTGVVDRSVVEEDERAVQPRDHEVLIGARVRHDRLQVRVAGKVLEDPATLDP